MEIVANNTKPVLENDNLKPYYKLLPKESKYFIKSIAVAPITLDSEIIGSLNQADFSAIRFQPGMDTSLLEQLAIKVSLCLSNVTAHEKLKFLAYRDPLTELLNRRVMATALKREFNRSKRYFSPLSVAFIDLDNFKQINDRYGHDCGDDILKYVADSLTDSSRDSDIIARFAGDEFVIILPETSAKNAKKFMNRLKINFMEDPLDIAGNLIRISISFGIASTEDKDIKDPTMLLKKADKRLLDAKKSGLNNKELNIIQFLADGKK